MAEQDKPRTRAGRTLLAALIEADKAEYGADHPWVIGGPGYGAGTAGWNRDAILAIEAEAASLDVERTP